MSRFNAILGAVAALIVINEASATQRAPASGKAADGQVIRVGESREIRSLQNAAQMARDGDIVEVDAGDYKGDTAVWTQNNLVVRGVGARPRIIFDGSNVAEGKGLFVVRGGNVTLENLAFSGARVSDRNGAGVRLDKGRLTIKKCAFEDNENGILTGNDADIEMHVTDSEFLNNGAGDGQSHHLYAGTIAALHVTGSYFGPARKGHLLKSRARSTSVLYSRLTGEGGTSSYEMDISVGGQFKAIGNLVQQGSLTENTALISYAAEGYKWPANQIYIAFNTLVNDRAGGGTFVAVRSGPANAVIAHNLLVGTGDLDVKAQADVKGNVRARNDAFVDAAKFDYRLRVGNPLVSSAGAFGSFGSDARPTSEYRHTAGSVELGLTSLTPLSPGAFQRLAR